MKLTLEMYGTKTIIETEEDDLTVDDMCNYMEQLLRGSGYSFDGNLIIKEEVKC